MASESDRLVKQLGEYLSNSDLEEAQKLCEDPRFEECYNASCWDLIEIVSEHINEKTQTANKKLFNFCEELLHKIADKSPPEESLLQIIDQIESLNDVTFTTLLIPMQKTVLRTKSKLGLSVEWCFNSVHRHLLSLPLPEDEDLEGEERKLMDIDPCVRRIADLYSSVIPFYEPFIHKLSSEEPEIDKKNKVNLRDSILCSCFRLLDRPLLFIDLEFDGKSKSSLRVSSEKIIDIISIVHPYLFSVLVYRDLSNIDDDLRRSQDVFRKDDKVVDTFPVEDKFSSVSLGVYCYLIFGEGIKLQELPQVYNPLFILCKNLYLSALLLKASQPIIQRKGLLLIKGTIDRISESSVPQVELDSAYYRHLIEGLYSTAVFSCLRENRELAVKLIKQLLFKFNLIGRYLLLTKMVKLANHSGIIGYLATIYKDILVDVLNKPSKDSEYLTDKKILRLLDLFCDLPYKAQSDLVELSDQIISSLNLIRYLIIRDSNNRTGIKEHVKGLEMNFMNPLQEGINLSRAHYKLKLKDVEEELRNNKPISLSTPIFIGEDKVPNLPPTEKIFIINSALNGFDVMESLLCRVKECITLYR